MGKLTVADKLPPLPPKLRDEFYKVAGMATANKRYAWGINSLEKYDRQYALSDNELYRLGLLYDHLAMQSGGKLKSRSLDKAENFYRRILKASPRYLHANYGIGRVYSIRGDYGMAIKYQTKAYNQMIKLPKNKRGALAIGGLYAMKGNLKAAERWYLKEYRNCPKNDFGTALNLFEFYRTHSQRQKAARYAGKLKELIKTEFCKKIYRGLKMENSDFVLAIKKDIAEFVGRDVYVAPVVRIYKKILAIYPFLTAKERGIFIKKAGPILEKVCRAGTLKDRVLLGRALLAILHNGHADLHTVYKKKRKLGPRIKPRVELDKKRRILIVTIPSWNKELKSEAQKLIRQCVNQRKKYDKIILDVRENAGGNSRIAHDFASIFFKRPVRYGTFVRRGKGSALKRTPGILEPNGKIYIDVPIAILISKKCFSSNELFLAPFKVSKRATLIGEPTRGGSANPISEEVTIDGIKMIARIPQWRFFLRGGKKPIEETKIKPDIRYSKSDIAAFAVRFLTK